MRPCCLWVRALMPGDAAATAFEDEVRILLGGKNMENGVAALLSGLGSLRVRVELAWSAAEVALKGAMIVVTGAGASGAVVSYD